MCSTGGSETKQHSRLKTQVALNLRKILNDVFSGIQGQSWGETRRTSDHVFSMIVPRLLALAERAWHKAAWEDEDDFEAAQTIDWQSFVNTLGYKEFARLDQLGVNYYIPPPGAQ